MLGEGCAAGSWYAEFRIGDFQAELGIIDRRRAPLPITAQGDQGFVTASVVDPFGNVLGVMYNLHYVEVTGAARPQ